ncbi:GFA family protein [Mesorhizobium sp. BR1-1-16]|uniref:GFA family protein n=1 Tax=Mesorhizobium sp. BR1-1-16 TaxID=2876653 RepID=UPI001CCCFBB9|nr:GFA family protein [Mesorhizobium sp. BR1-1-16]MBZ9937599.1 GFA family protein [Mesorhizobium sp. BR1-1-16]
MAEATDETGGCHCGKVRFEAHGDFTSAISCNCSICQKRGHWLAFVPASNFSVTAGEDNLTDYQFNRHIIHHLFCQDCGIEAFARAKGPDGSNMVAVNVRCIDGIDLASVTVNAYDGRGH